MKFFTVKRAAAELNQERHVAIVMSDRLLTSTSELKTRVKSVDRVECAKRIYRIIDLSVEIENTQAMTKDDQELTESRLKFERIFGSLTAAIGIIGYIATGGIAKFAIIACVGGTSLGIFIGEKLGLKNRFKKEFDKLNKMKRELLTIEKSNQETLTSSRS